MPVTDHPRLSVDSARQREHALTAIVLAQQDWPEVLRIAASASDIDQARAAVEARFGVDAEQATAMLDLQFGRLSEADRRRAREELDAVRTRLAGQ